MNLPTKPDISAAAAIVYEAMPPTPQFLWPLLVERLGVEVWLKHENHTPVCAFKIRGALAYLHRLCSRGQRPRAVVAATRGNHGQAVAFAAQRESVPAIVYVPQGNSLSKNRAMRSLGATLVEAGTDFQAARQAAQMYASEQNLHFIPSFHRDLVCGAATCAFELLSTVRDIDVLYVPIGLGSGICGACAAREALGLTTEIIGVVAEAAPAYARSFHSRRPEEHPAETALADGLACRVPELDALDTIWQKVSDVVTVTEAQIAGAMRILFEDTHNVAEGAGAAAVAAILLHRQRLRGKRVAAILSGGNVDAVTYAGILAAPGPTSP